jgi:hypothetical protein
MQVALNNATEGSSSDMNLFPSLIFRLFKLSCQCLKKPNQMIARSATDQLSPAVVLAN